MLQQAKNRLDDWEIMWDVVQRLFVDGVDKAKIKNEIDRAVEDVLDKVDDARQGLEDKQ